MAEHPQGDKPQPVLCGCPETTGGPYGSPGPVCIGRNHPGCRKRAEEEMLMRRSVPSAEGDRLDEARNYAYARALDVPDLGEVGSAVRNLARAYLRSAPPPELPRDPDTGELRADLEAVSERVYERLFNELLTWGLTLPGCGTTDKALAIIEQWSAEAMRSHALGSAPKLPALPEEIQEWCWHMDTHLTEHDVRHAGLALRAAWPHVAEWLKKHVSPSSKAGTPYAAPQVSRLSSDQLNRSTVEAGSPEVSTPAAAAPSAPSATPRITATQIHDVYQEEFYRKDKTGKQLAYSTHHELIKAVIERLLGVDLDEPWRGAEISSERTGQEKA